MRLMCTASFGCPAKVVGWKSMDQTEILGNCMNVDTVHWSIVCTATLLFQYRQQAWMYVVPEQILIGLKMSFAFTLALIFLATLYPKRKSAKGG